MRDGGSMYVGAMVCFIIGRMVKAMWLYSSDDLRHLGGRKLHGCLAPAISAERTSSNYRSYVVQLGPSRSGPMRSVLDRKRAGPWMVFILPLDMGYILWPRAAW